MKTWLEFTAQMQNQNTFGQSKNPDFSPQNRVATDLVNRNLSPNFLSQISMTTNNPQKLNLMSKQAGQIAKNNLSQIGSQNITPDFLNQKVADAAGLNIKDLLQKRL